MTTVTIIDSGGANIASLRYAFQRLGVDVVVTANATRIKQAERLVLPGVGAAAHAMKRLGDARLIDVIKEATQPLLGVCLGLHLLFEASEEGAARALGVLEGRAIKLRRSTECAVPNMGWCPTVLQRSHPLTKGIANGSYFYYLHSYAVPPGASSIATAQHSEEFSAVVSHNNFAAAQFHPERSAANGARLLNNFMTWSP